MLQKLNPVDFAKIYNLMEQSFPPDERRTFLEQKDLLNNPRYCIYALHSDNTEDIKAFIAVWKFDDFAFIEHFAVNPAYRNCGLGSSVLQEIKNYLSCMLCLEAELPNDEISKRRIDFYIRNGFAVNNYKYIQPPISKGRKPVPLLILTSGKEISEERFNEIKKLLYKYVYNI